MGKNKIKAPNVTAHFYFSIIKSALRISAGITLLIGNIEIAGILLIFAEFLGIAEEIF